MSGPARTVGRYVIVREIGRGGMAIVYLARQPDLEREVALKELAAFHALDPATAERFSREARVVGSLTTPTSQRCSSRSSTTGRRTSRWSTWSTGRCVR